MPPIQLAHPIGKMTSLTPVPYSFIKKHTSLTWREALWGYERQLIGWSAVVDLAVEKMLEGPGRPLEIEISNLGKSEASQAGELLRTIAKKEPEKKPDIADQKWLFIVLSWLFEHKDDISNPLGEIEKIYADFGYPSEIESFISYMPATDGYDPSQHSLEENKDRLLKNWEQYLSQEAMKYQQITHAKDV